MLDEITPVLLTYNESENIRRSLTKLWWADDVVVLDSYSTDETVSIVKQFEPVRLFKRQFDSHADQWNFALRETNIQTEWVLAMDADYLLTDQLISELGALRPQRGIGGYRAHFRYCVFGRPLRGALYPPVTVLYRLPDARYVQDGHTQRVVVQGEICELRNKILHDDRKPLSAWLQAQHRYMKLEADVLTERKWRDLSWPDRVRKLRVVAPVFVFLNCLLVQRGLLDGRAGLYYGFQRMLAETLLSLRLLEKDLPTPRKQ